jgi:hypothetical protein
MKTQDRANKLVSILLGEAGADDYLNKLGIVRHSKSTPPPPVKVGPDSLAGKILSGNALGDEDLDVDELMDRWANKRLRHHHLRPDRNTVEALLNDLGSDLDEYLEYNEDVYNRILEQISEELESSKRDPNGWFQMLKSVLANEDED